jgi:cytidine deaminase
MSVEELLQLLIPVAKAYARPAISNYNVGVAVLGKSGAIYLGVNLEFPGVPLNETVHGEQFAITNARSHGETELLMMALSAAPCGHCRQFMNEMVGEGTLQILIPDTSPVAYSTLLPEAFGPKDLGLAGNLLTPSTEYHPSSSHQDCCITSEALEAVLNSYAPYTNAQSGVAILTKDGSLFRGSYLENAAFNPSLSPLQAALVSFVADLRDYSEISEVMLFEKLSAKISQEVMSREILSNIAPEATFYAEKLKY